MTLRSAALDAVGARVTSPACDAPIVKAKDAGDDPLELSRYEDVADPPAIVCLRVTWLLVVEQLDLKGVFHVRDSAGKFDASRHRVTGNHLKPQFLERINDLLEIVVTGPKA
jgi:hypothetical protein